MKKGCQNFFQHPSFCRLLPKFQSLILRNEHLVARLHTEGLIPGIDMWQGSVDTPFAQSVWVVLDALTYLLLGDVLSPYACVGQEEALSWSETVLVLEGLLGGDILQSIEGYHQTAMVGKILAQCETAVAIQVGQYLDIAEEVGIHVGTLIEALGIVGCPPVLQIASSIILAALIVETVSHLMTYHDTDGAIVERLVGLGPTSACRVHSRW